MVLRRNFLWALVAALFAAVAFSSVAEARQLRFALGYPPGSITADAADVWAEALEKYSEGSLTARVYALSLLNLMETPAGLRDGLADAGSVLLTYFPNEFAHTNMLTELTLLLELGDNPPDNAGAIYAGALSEYVFLRCPECVAEYTAQNQVFTGSASTPPIPLLCTKPVRSLSEIRGKRLRGGGPQHQRWSQAIGATSVHMSVNEIYEALEQGVVECTIQTATELSVFKLNEVVTDITLGVPGGVYAASAMANMNADTWRSLNDAQRRAVLRAGAAMMAEGTWSYHQSGIENIEDARAKGIKVHEPDAELRAATHAFIEKDVDHVAEIYQKRYGIKRADEMIAEFRLLLDKWIKLVAEVKTAEELADLYWNEAYSKVDVSSYGM